MRKFFLSGLFFVLGSIFFAQNLHLFKSGENFGYFDDELKIVLEPVYDKAYPFFEGETVVRQGEKIYAIISEKGTRKRLPEYFDDKNVRRIYRLTAHCYSVETFEKDPNDSSRYANYFPRTYVYNTEKNEFLRCGNLNFSFETTDFNYLFSTGSGDDFGYYDDDLAVRNAPEKWKKLYPMRDGAALAIDKNNVRYIIDKDFKEILSGIGDSGSEFHDGLMPVVKNANEIGYINTKGEFVIKTKMYSGEFDSFPPSIEYDFSEGVVVPQVKKEIWRIYDKNGKLLMQDKEFYFCSKQKDGLIRFQKEKKGKY